MADMRHMQFIQTVAMEDVKQLIKKEETYQGSWKKRGGIGAFMMMARKWDRLETILSNDYDVFKFIAMDMDGKDGSVLAEVRDLRRYLLLIEAEMKSQQCQQDVIAHEQYLEIRIGTPEDGGQHARMKDRLDDGVTPDISEMPYYLMSAPLVDRFRLPPDQWEHLPRLPKELNHKEWDEQPDHYKTLFYWADPKWLMKAIYHEHWGKQ